MAPTRNASGMPASIPAALQRTVERFGRQEALVDDGCRLSYRELAGEVHQTAAALVASGVEPRDRVAIWAPNSGRWVVTALAVYEAGAVLVPVNTRFKALEAAHVLRTARVKLLFTVAEFLGTNYLDLLRESSVVAELDEVMVMAGGADRDAIDFAQFLTRAPEVAPGVLEARAAQLGPDDVSDIIFTSGTTGSPKGAMLQHGPSLWAYETWTAIAGLRADDRYLIMNPFFHVFGLKAGILASVLTGAAMVPHAVFDVPSVMQRVEAERISMLPGPPTVYQTMLDHPDTHRFDLSTLRLAVTGAATVPVEMVRRMRSELPFETILTGYGLSETVGIVSVCRPDDDAETVATTSGRPMPGVELKIVDASGAELGTEEPGEVLVRGYNMMLGYFDNPEATADALDADGWLHTGDIGLVDAAGNVRITDRKKDLFIVGGFNAYPAEIENILACHPAVSQVAVVGVPDHRLGEVGMAFVVSRPETMLDGPDLIAWSRENMANYKVPRYVHVVDALPMNATGKVLKYELREIGKELVAGDQRS